MLKNNFKILWLLLLIAGFFFLHSSVWGQNPPVLNGIHQKKLVIALPSFDEPLLFYRDSKNELQGFEIDIIRNIAKTLNLKIVFERTSKSYDEVVEKIASGKDDIDASALSKTLSRARKVFFTQSYLMLYKTIMFERLWMAEALKNNRFKDWDEVKILKDSHYSLGVIEGTAYVEFAQKLFPQVSIVPFSDWKALIDALSSEKIQAIFYDDLGIKYFFFKNPDMALKYKAIVFKNEPDEIALAVSHQNNVLLHWLNLYLHLNKISYDADQVIQKYAHPKNS